MLEAGRRFADEELATTSWQLRKFLWAPALGCYGIQRIHLLRDLVVLAGAGVGGGSLNYANTLYRPPDAFFRDPQWAHITDWRAELDVYYDQAQRMLGGDLRRAHPCGRGAAAGRGGDGGRRRRITPRRWGCSSAARARRSTTPTSEARALGGPAAPNAVPIAPVSPPRGAHPGLPEALEAFGRRAGRVPRSLSTVAASDYAQTAEFYAGLPTTRGAAGALLIDEAGRVLLVERVYDAAWPWGLPGGIIEADESPLGACVREIREELGIDPVIEHLAAVDWVSPRPPITAGNMFVFTGRIPSASAIRLDPAELSAWQWVTRVEIARLLPPHTARRVEAAFTAHTDQCTVYLEDGYLLLQGSP